MARLRRSSIILLVATAGSFAAAAVAPLHQHHPAHVDKRAIKVVEVPGPTKIVFELNGENVDEAEVCNGIKAGTLKWAEGTENPPNCPASNEVSQSAPSATSASTTSSDVAVIPSVSPASTASLATPTPAKILSTALSENVQPTTSAHVEISSTTPLVEVATPIAFIKEAVKVEPGPTSQASVSSPSSSAAASVQSQVSPSTSSVAPGNQGVDLEFPDNEIDCTTFPSDYGPINVEWAKLGGWSGIQYVTIEGNEVTHIDTAVPGGEGCKPGAMCSYACPPGYQKSQWPSTQGSTGQSVGGLSCNSNGKLSLTNPSLSRNLCIQGTGAVTVQNKLSNNAAICRTDYPGTENEVVPLNTEPESINPLTCPDASTYYTHQGDPTTAQYYVNNQGVALEDACIWGTDGTDRGNWAPSYFGVGQDVYGKTWCSIASTAQNDPSNYHPLNYTVKIIGNISGNCGLVNGQYCMGDDYTQCNALGCTVELFSGQATYVLENGSSLSN